jgi:hypothetical protein
MAALLHLTYGIGLLAGEYDVEKITAVYLTGRTFGAQTWLVFVFVALLSVLPMVRPMKSEHIHLCLWPQQTILFIMAASAMTAAIGGHYPDGTVKNGLFIFIDQSWTVYLALAHFATTLRNAMLGDAR